MRALSLSPTTTHGPYRPSPSARASRFPGPSWLSANCLEIKARIKVFACRRRVFDPGIGHEEIGRLLQPSGDGAVRIHFLPFLRREHLLRRERFVDVGHRRLAVVSFLQRFHRGAAIGYDVFVGFGPALDQLGERFLVGLVVGVRCCPAVDDGGLWMVR